MIVLTRPLPAAHRTAFALRRMGIDRPILFSPVVAISIIGTEGLPDGVLVFTSENGVNAARKMGDLAHRPVIAVGPRTAAVARAAGAETEIAGGDVASLSDAIVARGGGPYVHLRGAETTGQLVADLRSAGIEASEQVIYRQITRPMTDAARNALLSERPTCMPLFSVRSAERVLEALDCAPRATTVVALSNKVAERWPWSPPALVADRTDLAAMCNAIRTAIESQPAGGKTT